MELMILSCRICCTIQSNHGSFSLVTFSYESVGNFFTIVRSIQSVLDIMLYGQLKQSPPIYSSHYFCVSTDIEGSNTFLPSSACLHHTFRLSHYSKHPSLFFMQVFYKGVAAVFSPVATAVEYLMSLNF